MDTGAHGYTALDFALHDSHVLNANVFMRPLGRVGIYRVLLYNLYSGARVTDVPYIYNNNNNNKLNIWIANVQLVYVGLAQARPNYINCEKLNLFHRKYLVSQFMLL